MPTFVNQNVIKYLFKTICIVSALSMAAYWCYKFEIEDRDVGVVDYVPIDESLDIPLPVASVCFRQPFIEARLMNLKPPRDRFDYQEYIAGEEGLWVEYSERIWVEGSKGHSVEEADGVWSDGSEGTWVYGKRVFDENLTLVDYFNVTLNLGDYWMGDYVFTSRRNGSLAQGETVYHVESFSGFLVSKNESLNKYENFEKCFEIRPNIPDHLVEMIIFGYNISAIWNDLGGQRKSNQMVTYNIHYPGQHLLRPDYALPDEFDFGSVNQNFVLRIKDIEVIKSRNSRNRKCTSYDDRKSFDDMVKEKHIMTHKCRAPYLKPFQDFPKCSTKESLRESYYDYKTVRNKYYPASCQRLSKITYEVSKKNWEIDGFENGNWGFGLIYPDHIRIITQSKEVDIHSLIGNIGGYIGLFLGNIFYFVRS